MQTINSRDVERMRRELQAAERNIEEAEAARISWEEKCWDLDSAIGQKFKELEQLAMECNKAIRRSDKFSSSFCLIKKANSNIIGTATNFFMEFNCSIRQV